MIATRTALPALRATRTVAARRFNSTAATPPPPTPEKKASNAPFVFGLAGVAGLAAFAYLNRGAAKAPAKPAVPALEKDTWIPVKVSKIDSYNHNTKVYRLDFQGEDAKDKVSGITVAGAIVVKTPEGEGQVLDAKGKPVIRPYTPLSPPDQRGSLDLLVKEYPTGNISKWFGTLAPGAEVLIKGPILKYEYKPNTFDKGLFVTGGSGVTPAYQFLTHALNDKSDKTKFTLLFANVNEEDILLRKEWDALAAANPDRLKVVYFLDNAPKGWNGETGYVTADKITQHFPRGEGEKVQAFVCGPPGQYAAVSGKKDGFKQGELGGALKDLGYTSEEVFKF
ncbi:hypothetical protein Q8F55_000252 [Vanrija albida]|uniref:cytochrome-b5 reductase n=1 Tax=Vanrija albida TaxID=181172 RepID=A0ABR3QCQ9_9TREE